MRSRKEREAFFRAIEQGEEPVLAPGAEVDVPLVDVEAVVRHLSGTLDEASVERVLRLASRDRGVRRQLVEVAEELEELRKRRPSEAAALRTEVGVKGRIANAWLSIVEESIVWGARLRLDRGRVALEEIGRSLGAAPYLRAILASPAPRPRPLAMFRGEDGVELRHEKDEIVLTAMAADMRDGERVSVVLRGDVEVVLGSTSAAEGRATLRLPGWLPQVVDVEKGGIAVVSEGGEFPGAFPLEILALEGEASLEEPPTLVALPRLEGGTLSVTIAFPEAFLGRYAGRTIRFFLEPLRGMFQLVGTVVLEEGTRRATISADLDSTSEVDGAVACRLRYEVEA